jgi:uncharacterized membrane protein YhiD involved in acid resistance
LWLAAAIGLAAGGGMYLLAAVSTAVSPVGLIYLRRVEGKQWRLLQRRVVVDLDGDSDLARGVVERLQRFGASVTDVDYDRNLREGRTRLTVDIRLPDRAALERLIAEIGDAPGVRRVKILRPG